MIAMPVPSQRTIKRLFAVSGNRCAFPNCQTHLSDEHGIIIGEICHIEADSLVLYNISFGCYDNVFGASP